MIYTIDNPKQVSDYYSANESNFTGVLKDKDGNIAYYVNNSIHRNDGPSVYFSNGTIAYCQYGKIHREDGPAVIQASGTELYFCYSEIHRKDGPAIINADGTKEYWIENNKLDISTDAELKDYLLLRMFE